MAELQDISILIIDDSFEEISRISSVLDNSGFRVRSHKAETVEELTEQLNSIHLDTILIKQDNQPLTPKLLLQTLNRLDKDIPALVLAPSLSGKETAQFIRMGAKDVIAEDEDQHMVAVISRELKNKISRAQHRSVLRKLSAAENRYQQLIEYSKLPMAIVQESMFVVVNESFCELFELDPEDIDALPVVDILDKDGRQAFKDLYKKYLKAPEAFGTEELETTFTDALGETKQVLIEIHTVKYNDEDSLQLKIEPTAGDTQTEIFADPSGAMPRHRMIQFIENCIGLASSGTHEDNRDSCLACIEIDGFDAIQEAQGIGLADELYSAFQLYVSDHFPGKPLCAFDSNNLLMLFEAQGQHNVVEDCAKFCEQVDQHVFEFGDNSQQVTCTIGVALISELVTSTDAVIKRSIKACEQLQKKAEAGIGNGAALYEPEASEIEQEAIDINYLIKQAFKHDHLQLLFQPLLNFHGESGKHYEVLLGLKAEFSESYPTDFIAMATRSNENHEIDKWVVLESMRTLIKKEVCDGDESLYIHISKQSLRNPKFIPWLSAAISKSKIKASRLAFQLREPDVSPNLNIAADLVKDISKLGCKVIITNFGSSVQPMKILESMKFDFAKVDMSFALNAQNGGEGAQTLTNLLDQIASTGIPAIVPCIESAAVLPILWKSNVAYIQGYYVQAPSPVMDYAP
eukprot:g4478.t1